MRFRATICFAAALLSSCVPNRAYHVQFPKGKPPVVEAPLYEQAPINDCDDKHSPGRLPYRLAFIEFDDRGEMFHRDQLKNALDVIDAAKKEAAALAQKDGQEHEAAVITFVHGWKNNASERSGNVWGFRKTLACFAQNFDPVVGIYIGWRGAVLSPPVLKELTFYDRRDKSQNLPNAHLIEALLGIMRAAKGPEYTDSTVSLLIGHSFGGALLETALIQTLENVILRTPSGQPIRWPADLIVFVNEAAPAIISYQLIESMLHNIEARPPCDDNYDPALISISSTGDYATRAFFPLGQAVSRPFNSLRKYPSPNSLGLNSQRPMFFNPTAHQQQFQTHVLDLATDPSIVAARKPGCQFVESRLEGTAYSMVDLPHSKNRSPYWVLHMPPTIVPDHSTIFGARFRKLLIDFIVIPRQIPGRKPYIRK